MVVHFESRVVLLTFLHMLHSSARLGSAAGLTAPCPEVSGPVSFQGHGSNTPQGSASLTILPSGDITTLSSRHVPDFSSIHELNATLAVDTNTFLDASSSLPTGIAPMPAASNSSSIAMRNSTIAASTTRSLSAFAIVTPSSASLFKRDAFSGASSDSGSITAPFFISTGSASSTSTGLQARPGIIPTPRPVYSEPSTSFDVRSTASDLSVALVGVLPLLEECIQTPNAPQITAVTDTLNDILPTALDLLGKLPKPADGVEPCYESRRRRRERGSSRLRQRSLFGGLFKTPFSLVNCVVETTSRVRDEVVKGTKNTVDTLGKLQDTLKPMLDALNEVEEIKPLDSPSRSPTSAKATSASLSSCSSQTISNCNVRCTALATTTIGGLFKRGNEECTTACAAAITTCGRTGSTSASTTTSTTTVSQFLYAQTCTACNSKHPRLAADDSILPGYSKALNSIVVKPSPTATRSLSGDISVKASENGGLHKRTLPNPSTIFDVGSGLHSVADMFAAFLLVEIRRSHKLAHGTGLLGDGKDTTGITALLWSKRDSWSLVNLYGCTSVIVISRRRMYMTHIWENPTMIASPSIFKKQALDALQFGDQGTPGLQQFTKPGGDFENNRRNNVHALIITPLLIPGVQDQPKKLRYGKQIQKIEELLQKVIGIKEAAVFPYVSRGPDEEQTNGHGKVLIQYDPASEWIKKDQHTHQYAAIEVWFEGYKAPRFQQTWRALAHQLCLPDKNGEC